jgi:hypothetical protein
MRTGLCVLSVAGYGRIMMNTRVLWRIGLFCCASALLTLGTGSVRRPMKESTRSPISESPTQVYTDTLSVERFRKLPLQILKLVSESDRPYLIEVDPSEEEIVGYLERERDLFREGLVFTGDHRIDCGRAVETIEKAQSSHELYDVFFCAYPGDEAWQRAVDGLSRLGLVFHDMAPEFRIVIDNGEEQAVIKATTSAWLSYALAKALWKNEPNLRLELHGEARYTPTVVEEKIAFYAGVAAYLNSRAPSEEIAEPADEDPDMENLVRVVESGRLRGYILFEVLHKTYGVSLQSLSTADRAAVSDYIEAFAIRQARPGSVPPSSTR